MGLYANRALMELIYKVGDKLKKKERQEAGNIERKGQKVFKIDRVPFPLCGITEMLDKNAYSTTDFWQRNVFRCINARRNAQMGMKWNLFCMSKRVTLPPSPSTGRKL